MLVGEETILDDGYGDVRIAEGIRDGDPVRLVQISERSYVWELDEVEKEAMLAEKEALAAADPSKKNRIKLDAHRLLCEAGLPVVQYKFPHIQFSSVPGSAVSNLHKLVYAYREWAQRLHPNMHFKRLVRRHHACRMVCHRACSLALCVCVRGFCLHTLHFVGYHNYDVRSFHFLLLFALLLDPDDDMQIRQIEKLGGNRIVKNELESMRNRQWEEIEAKLKEQEEKGGKDAATTTENISSSPSTSINASSPSPTGDALRDGSNMDNNDNNSGGSSSSSSSSGARASSDPAVLARIEENRQRALARQAERRAAALAREAEAKEAQAREAEEAAVFASIEAGDDAAALSGASTVSASASAALGMKRNRRSLGEEEEEEEVVLDVIEPTVEASLDTAPSRSPAKKRAVSVGETEADADDVAIDNDNNNSSSSSSSSSSSKSTHRETVLAPATQTFPTQESSGEQADGDGGAEPPLPTEDELFA